VESVPDLVERGSDVGGGDDEVVSPQLWRVRVLDPGDALGVVHCDAGGRVDGGTTVAPGPSGAVCCLHSVGRGVSNDEHLSVVGCVAAGPVGVD